VLFSLLKEMSREEAIAKYRARVPVWQGNPDLIHKTFVYDEGCKRGGGIYLWKNIEAAKKAHGPAFQEAIQFIFGSKPEMQYFEAPIVIDNTAQQVLDNAAFDSALLSAAFSNSLLDVPLYLVLPYHAVTLREGPRHPHAAALRLRVVRCEAIPTIARQGVAARSATS
jgi:hypothetical protein